MLTNCDVFGQQKCQKGNLTEIRNNKWYMWRFIVLILITNYHDFTYTWVQGLTTSHLLLRAFLTWNFISTQIGFARYVFCNSMRIGLDFLPRSYFFTYLKSSRRLQRNFSSVIYHLQITTWLPFVRQRIILIILISCTIVRSGDINCLCYRCCNIKKTMTFELSRTQGAL